MFMKMSALVKKDFHSRRDSRRETKFPAAKISPGPRRDSRQYSRREAKFLAAKILPGSEIPGSHNLAENLAKDLDEIYGKNPGKIFGYWEFLSSVRFMAGILARFMAGTIDSA